MPSDSVTSFLDRATAHRLLTPAQIADLLSRSDVPHAHLPSFCDALQANGVLTPFQADAVRGGRPEQLAIAGYPVTDALGPCPGGEEYRVLHPVLRSPLVLRRVRAEWFNPADDVAGFVARGRAASAVTHPGLSDLFDVGTLDTGDAYAVVGAFDGKPLDALVKDIGPMPAHLACGFARQAAAALAAAHARGPAHGAVSPATLRVGPLVASSKTLADGSPLFRPAPDAVVKVFEYGLLVRRPGGPDATPARDVADLGRTLYFLLTARPFGPKPLAEMRPDLPPELLAVVSDMLAGGLSAAAAGAALAPFDPNARVRFDLPPETLAATSSIISNDAGRRVPPPEEPVRLTLEPEPEPEPEPVSLEVPPAPWTVTAYDGPDAADAPPVFAVEAPEPPPSGLFASHDGPAADPFAPPSNDGPVNPAARRPPPKETNWKLWAAIGLGFWLTAGGLWVVLLSQSGCFGTAEPPPRATTKTRLGSP